MKHIIPILVVLLLLSSGFVGLSNTAEIDSEQKSTDEKYTYNRFNEHYYPEGYLSGQYPPQEYDDVVSSEEVMENEEKTVPGDKYHKSKSTATSGGPMDSPWPMFMHDARHTGRSSYSTVNTWDEIWNFKTLGPANSPAIDKNGITYIGSYDLYAVYPNGTLKWMYNTGGVIESCCPAIDEDGVVYVGTAYAVYGDYLYAIYSNNGTLKWKYGVSNIFSSPVIGSDGTIFFTDSDNWNIIALYPNGTQKWVYHTNHVIYSSPAIGLDGTIYCGSHDDHVYALYPNNGTLKWKYNTGSWVHGSPTIADDGTVYIGSDNGILYAFYPNNGTLKWKVGIGAVYASPALDEDGTLYVGVWNKHFYSIYPNGTIKWNFHTGRGRVWGSSAALSEEGTLYFGTCDLEWTGGIEIIALYTDGTVKWRKGLDTVFSSPAIGSDGTVYIGSCGQPGEGFLNAFGVGELEPDAHGPHYGLINEPVQFSGSATGGYQPYSWHWDFGDGNTSDEQNPIHTYTYPGNFTVTLTVTDNTSNTSNDTTWAWIQASNDPPDKPSIDGTINGAVGVEYDYTFVTADPDGNDVWYGISWGEPAVIIYGPYPSGKELILSHSWSEKGSYTIECHAFDVYGELSETATLEVTMPLNQDMWFLRWLERFPRLQWLLGVLGWNVG